MNYYNRKQKIKEILEEKNFCTIEYFVKKFNVSRVTIHRDLNDLEKQGYVKKVIGGAQFNREKISDLNFNKRLGMNILKKKEIAKKALKFISNGDSIFIDSSTTCFLFASEISSSNFSNISIVTNSPFAVCKLSNSPYIHIISTGGELQYQLNGLVGTITNNFIHNVNFDKAFISARGISVKNGLSTSQPYIVEVLQKVIEASREVNLLVDSSKFDRSGILKICSCNEITRIITDKYIDSDVMKEIREHGIECI